MRFPWLLAAMLPIAGILSSSAFAMSQADYTALHTTAAVTQLQGTGSLPAEYARLVGQQIEFHGVVQQIIPHTTWAMGYLRLDSGKTVRFAVKPDPDLRTGVTLSVLARVPRRSTLLWADAVTPMTEVSVAADPRSTNAGIGTQVLATPRTVTSQETGTASISQASTHPVSAQQTAASPDAQQYILKIRQYAPRVAYDIASVIVSNVLAKSAVYGVDPRLVLALLAQESHFNPRAVSPVGAMGLGQLMPYTAAKLGVAHPFDIADNIDGSIRYLAQQLQTFHGNIQFALAAYNAGPASVTRYGGIPPYRETQHYVQTISAHYYEMQRQL